MGFPRQRDRAIPKHLSIWWPVEYPHPGSHFHADQILGGLRQLGLPIVLTDIPQPPGTVVVFRVVGGAESDLIAFDLDDSPEIVENTASHVLVYFKQQYANEGYRHRNVVPAGYMPANKVVYHYLPLLRAIRSLKRFRYDVYCRFGLRYGGQEMRQRAHQLLSARTDFRYEGSLFHYPGGPQKMPYRRYLFEIPRAKVCVDMPGNGDLCARLIDYLAVGACVVKPPPSSRLPVRLVDGVHVVYCADDLSDLGDVCAQLVRDEEQREAIARNARDFFDRYLHRRRLGERYLDEITDAQAASGRRARLGHRQGDLVTHRAHATAARDAARVLRPGNALARTLAVALVILMTLVALPEALGDRPYDPRPSRAFTHH